MNATFRPKTQPASRNMPAQPLSLRMPMSARQSSTSTCSRPPVVGNWNEEFSGPQNLMTGLCTSCHREGACAAEQVPEYGLHPDRVYMALLEEKSATLDEDAYRQFLERYPVYTDGGVKCSEGNIVCTTCQDAHVWDPHHERKGPGTKIEGNATTSFLRKDISFSFCASCHGEDAIFMFKYFHVLKGRQKPEPPAAEEAAAHIAEQPLNE